MELGFSMRQVINNFWETWKRFGRFMGNIVSRVVFTLLYFTLFAPFGIGARLFTDPLQIKQERESSWNLREAVGNSLEDIKRQF